MTSGGDCPGINATIRGVCKTAINHYGMEVIGIHSGFQGLLTKDVESFTDKSLSGLLNLGGTMLGTSREKPFKKHGVVSDVDKPALIEKNVKEHFIKISKAEKQNSPLVFRLDFLILLHHWRQFGHDCISPFKIF